MQEEIHQVYASILDRAMALKIKNGELYPIAMSMESSGNIVAETVHTGNDYPQSADLLQLLRRVQMDRVTRREVKICAVCYDTTVSSADAKPVDALVVDIESAEECARVAVPYKKRLFRSPAFGEPIRLPMEPIVFAHHHA